jgi:hypothetical protein
VCHTGPGGAASRLEKTPPDLVGWLSKDERGAALAKGHHLGANFELPTQMWFEKPVERLTRNLHGFFQSRAVALQRAQALGGVVPKPDPRRDYHEFLSWFARAITEFQSPADILQPTDPVMDFEDFAGHISGALSDFEPFALVINASDGDPRISLNAVRKSRHDPDQPELEPLRKMMRLQMKMGLEGDEEIGVFDVTVAEVTYF